MNLSKSIYCEGLQCKKRLWLEKKHPEEKVEISNQSVLDNGNMVGKIAKDLFGEHIDIFFNSDLEVMINETKKVLKRKDVIITEASFKYKNNFCSIDLLIKNDNNFKLYEVKSSTEIEDIYLDDVSYQYYIMSKLGYNVTNCHIVYINNKYERQGLLELNKLFIIEDVTKEAKNRKSKVSKTIKEIEDYFKEDNHNEKIGLHCFKPYECPFFKYCTKSLPINNVFNIRQMNIKTKFKLYNKGKYSYEDLQNENINDKYKEQVLFSLNKLKPIIKKENIASFMSELTYPLYFLDFETFQQAIPKFNGVKPYMQIPFQYSLHYIESENSELKHKEFLAEASIDPRRGLAEKLVKDIPKNVCVLAYNMGFEKSVIKNLASLFPDLSNHLMNIYNNLKDLMIPFQKRDYVTKEMSGSYSIKYVLPALFPNDPSLDYHNLELVHKGDEASSFYANLHNYSKEEQLKIRTCLLKYCELDTFAMVKIWQKLNEIIKDN